VISVLVADDEALVRRGLAVLLRSEPGFEVTGEAADGSEAVALARTGRPDLILMDVRMPRTDGIEATRLITADPELSGVRVLMLTTFDLDEYVFAALRAGASGFLLKDTLPEELLAAIRVVVGGEALLAPSVTRRLIGEFLRAAPTDAHGDRADPAGSARERLRDLTERELEVLGAVAHGLSNAEIAQQLCMSYATAKTHVSRLLTKLDARDRAQLVMVAYDAGVVQPPTG
jgi:DNA-binding NarL/FixJ family response regulator